MKIPRTLHQTWKDHDIPEDFKMMSQTWKDKHPEWEYKFWTDEMNRDFIKEHFSFFLDTYDNYQTNIQRVDAVRYFVLYKYGGFFIDMDFECLASLDGVLSNASCVFGMEPDEHCQLHQKSIIISNAFMGAIPGFHFFDRLCNELQDGITVTDHANDRVLESTGPFMLSRVYDGYDKKEEISLLDASHLYPFSKDELEQMENGQAPEDYNNRLGKAYGIHHYAGTWWKK